MTDIQRAQPAQRGGSPQVPDAGSETAATQDCNACDAVHAAAFLIGYVSCAALAAS